MNRRAFAALLTLAWLGGGWATAQTLPADTCRPAPPVVRALQAVVCLKDRITLVAEGCTGYVVWSNGELGTQLTVSVVDLLAVLATCHRDSCKSDPARFDSLSLRVELPPQPLVQDLTTTCPQRSADLRKAPTLLPGTPGGSFEFYGGPSPDSLAVPRPDSVGAGSYFVVEKTAHGCFSPAARIDVTLADCSPPKPPPADTADVRLRFRADRDSAAVGDVIHYQVRVHNGGPGVANPLVIKSVLPISLLFETAPDFARRGDTLVARVDSLAAGDSLVLGFTARVAEAGLVLSQAWVQTAQTDPRPADNADEVRVTATARVVVPSFLGLALAVTGLRSLAPDDYEVDYALVLKSYGPDSLRAVAVDLNLMEVFFRQNFTFAVLSAPSVEPGSSLVVNALYDGLTDTQVLRPASRLAPGRSDTIRLTLRVQGRNATEPFYATALGAAQAGGQTLSEVSTDGLEPDPNGNQNPTDAGEDSPTPLRIATPLSDSIEVAEGFSPNNDGINDTFRVTYAGPESVRLEVFSRWGQLVFFSENYRNTWAGKSNQGLFRTSDLNDVLPDGTYYFVIRAGKLRRVGYLTLLR